MKWIGQHIYDQISRFRDDVYLEDISSGTIASGGNLGLDSNNKIVKQADTGITDLHGAGVDGSNNQLLTDDGDGTITSEANLTFDGSTLSIEADLNSTANALFIDADRLTTGAAVYIDVDDVLTTASNKSLHYIDYLKSSNTPNGVVSSVVGSNVKLINSGSSNHAGSANVKAGYKSLIGFVNTLGTQGIDGFLSEINLDTGSAWAAHPGGVQSFFSKITNGDGVDFKAVSSANSSDQFTIETTTNGATTLTTVDADASLAHLGVTADGDITLNAKGQIKLEPIAGNNILLDGTIQIDAGVVTGATSITSTAFVGTLSTASQPNITTVGTIGTGTWQGTAIASAYLDADTAHLTTNQTFTGVKTFNEAINKKSLNFIWVSNKFVNSTANETYFSLGDSDRDQAKGSEDGVGIVAIMPCDGILRHVEMNSSSNLSVKTWTYRLYRIPSGTAYTSEILVATVATNADGASSTNVTISLITDPEDGTNDITYESGYSATTMFTKGDRALFSLQSNSDAAGTPKINTTFCFELDETTL